MLEDIDFEALIVVLNELPPETYLFDFFETLGANPAQSLEMLEVVAELSPKTIKRFQRMAQPNPRDDGTVIVHVNTREGTTANLNGVILPEMHVLVVKDD